jgi:hypothetical protein
LPELLKVDVLGNDELMDIIQVRQDDDLNLT